MFSLSPQPGAVSGQVIQAINQQVFFVCLDIETCHSPDAFELEKEFVKPAGNIKDEAKKQANIAEKLESMKEKSALLDTAHIGVIGIHMGGNPVVMHTDNNLQSGIISGPDGKTGVQCTTFSDSKAMLIGLRSIMDSRYQAAVQAGQPLYLVGFNSIKFDLPKLRLYYVRHKLKLPMAIRSNTEGVINYDVMLKFCKYYTKTDTMFMSLDHVCALLGIREAGKPIDSSLVPDLLQQGQTTTVALHCGLDVVKTTTCWQMMESFIGE